MLVFVSGCDECYLLLCAMMTIPPRSLSQAVILLFYALVILSTVLHDLPVMAIHSTICKSVADQWESSNLFSVNIQVH